jgi:transcriptional regulator
MAKEPLDLVLGTLDMLVLQALGVQGPSHGYGIMAWIRARTAEELTIEEGALYPALHRMEGRGWIEPEWGLSENNRRAKYYRLTGAGRRALQHQTEQWSRYVALVDRVLQPA